MNPLNQDTVIRFGLSGLVGDAHDGTRPDLAAGLRVHVGDEAAGLGGQLDSLEILQVVANAEPELECPVSDPGPGRTAAHNQGA
jgi:hypothetical protein